MDAAESILTVTEHYPLPTSSQNNEYLPPHPNLAFRPLKNTEEYRPTLSTVFHNELQPYDYGRCDSFHSLQVTLLQLVHALHHLYSHGFVHSRIRKENIYVTSGSGRLVLIVDAEKLQRRGTRRRTEDELSDIADLGLIFREILHKNEGLFDKPLSDHLLEHMNMDARIWETGKLLKHAFFWEVQKKASFLLNVAQFSKSNLGYRLKAQLDAVKVFERICQTDNPDGWKSRLKLGPQEKDRCKWILRCRSTQRRLRIDPMESLYRKTDSKGNNNYDGRKIQSLLNFMRNRVEHFHEDGYQVQACFHFDKVDGIYCFFTRRFPHLFTDVYKIALRYTQNNRDSGIEQFFTEAENRDFQVGR